MLALTDDLQNKCDRRESDKNGHGQRFQCDDANSSPAADILVWKSFWWINKKTRRFLLLRAVWQIKILMNKWSLSLQYLKIYQENIPYTNYNRHIKNPIAKNKKMIIFLSGFRVWAIYTFFLNRIPQVHFKWNKEHLAKASSIFDKF